MPDVWHNLVVSINLGITNGPRNGGNNPLDNGQVPSVKVFIDGEYYYAGNYDDPDARGALEATFLFLAGRPEHETDWDVAELALWDVALTPAQVKAVQVEIDAR
ncbi:hypothetical protein AGMMS49965_14690 [Bacteroidia bacterium]|nr:hypothetical protein AGMMS49965_14690 [Bacteroidia bacterium]